MTATAIGVKNRYVQTEVYRIEWSDAVRPAELWWTVMGIDRETTVRLRNRLLGTLLLGASEVHLYELAHREAEGFWLVKGHVRYEDEIWNRFERMMELVAEWESRG